MSRSSLAGCAFAGIAALALSTMFVPPRAAAQDPAGPASLAPLVTWSGPDSTIKEATFQRVIDDAAWLKLWEKHTGRAAQRDNIGRPFIPKINFERCMVVAIFQGARVNCNGVVVESVIVAPDRIVFRFDVSGYQTAAAFDDRSGRGGAVDSTPFGIFVMPRSSKSLVIEENVQDLKDHPPQWKERARFD